MVLANNEIIYSKGTNFTAARRRSSASKGTIFTAARRRSSASAWPTSQTPLWPPHSLLSVASVWPGNGGERQLAAALAATVVVLQVAIWLARGGARRKSRAPKKRCTSGRKGGRRADVGDTDGSVHRESKNAPTTSRSPDR